jgi:predicted alpha/beta-fold hydrolase
MSTPAPSSPAPLENQHSPSASTRDTEFGDTEFVCTEFAPRRFLRNGHLQTIAGNFLPRSNALPEPEAHIVQVAPATATRAACHVLCHTHWQPKEVRRNRLTVLLLHGLEGSSNSQYVIGNANKLWRAGANIIRMNMRNCNGTEHLSPSLYHSGMSGDVRAVAGHFVQAQQLESLALVGYSMGGNLVMKMAGEVTPAGMPQLKAVVGVSPAVDLGPSADALHERQNRLYERRFVRELVKRYRRKAALFPHIYSTERASQVRSIREFDEYLMTPHEGFAGADDYYHRAAAARVVDRIAVPALVLHALDDPFIRMTAETREKLVANPNIALVETQHGGHCAFLATPNPTQNNDGYWAETTLLRFLLATVNQ